MKKLVGITCCNKPFGPFAAPNHAASDTYIRATDALVGGIPVLIPANGEAADIPALLTHLGGIILTGSRSNVAPALYAGPPHADGIPEDPERDAVTMALIRAALAAGIPVLGICRGMQEINVALGGSLHQRLQDLPGRLDHSAPNDPDPAVRTGKRHEVAITEGGMLRSIIGAPGIAVNSLHNQGVDRLAASLRVEAVAPDGTIEAVRVEGPTGFALGVQWHPEYDYETDAASRAIFLAFGAAVRGG